MIGNVEQASDSRKIEAKENAGIVYLDLRIMDPEGTIRVLHGDIRPSGNVRLRGANKENRWCFFSNNNNSGKKWIKHDLSIQACVDGCFYRRNGKQKDPRLEKAEIGDELWVRSSNGTEYFVGEVLKVLPPAQASELDDYADNDFGNEPI